MSKIQQIQALIAIVDEGSFSAAAKKQGVTTAAISRLIHRLESSLNTTLLKRSTRSVSLTEAGETYYQHCKQAFEQLTAAEQAICSKQDKACGELTIMCNRHFAMTQIIPRLDTFLSENPNLRLHFELAERFPDLSAENIDIVFGIAMDNASELVQRRVATTRYVLCASPDYLQKHGTPTCPDDLKDHLYITHSKRQPDDVLVFNQNKKISLKPHIRLNDTQAMRECAQNGLGITNLHDYIVSDLIKNGQLVEILRDYQKPCQHVYLYYQQSKYLLPKIRKFIDFFCS